MYMYIYTYVYIYVCICLYYIYMHICIYMQGPIAPGLALTRTDVLRQLLMYTCTYIYICIYIYTHTCIYIYLCVYIYISIYIYTHIYVQGPSGTRIGANKIRSATSTARLSSKISHKSPLQSAYLVNSLAS